MCVCSVQSLAVAWCGWNIIILAKWALFLFCSLFAKIITVAAVVVTPRYKNNHDYLAGCCCLFLLFLYVTAIITIIVVVITVIVVVVMHKIDNIFRRASKLKCAAVKRVTTFPALTMSAPATTSVSGGCAKADSSTTKWKGWQGGVCVGRWMSKSATLMVLNGNYYFDINRYGNNCVRMCICVYGGCEVCSV